MEETKNLYTMQRNYQRRGRSYCSYGPQDKSEVATFMRPIPFDSTQEAWFLRPNLLDRQGGHVVPAINHFAKQDHAYVIPDQKVIYKKSSRVLLTVTN